MYFTFMLRRTQPSVRCVIFLDVDGVLHAAHGALLCY